MLILKLRFETGQRHHKEHSDALLGWSFTLDKQITDFGVLSHCGCVGRHRLFSALLKC